MKHSTANPFVTALATGAPEAYAALYDRLGPSMLRVARTMLHHSPDAEDAVHDVFVDLARNRDRLAQVRDLDAYVFAMLRHAVSRRIERGRTERRHIRELTPPQDTSTAQSLTDDLQNALKTLPTDQREVIALKIDGGLTFAQVAEVLNVSPNTAASRYRYALEKLRRILE